MDEDVQARYHTHIADVEPECGPPTAHAGYALADLAHAITTNHLLLSQVDARELLAVGAVDAINAMFIDAQTPIQHALLAVVVAGKGDVEVARLMGNPRKCIKILAGLRLQDQAAAH